MVDKNNPADKWFWSALGYSIDIRGLNLAIDATYEAVGKHFQGNPYNIAGDFLIRHGADIRKDCPRSFEGIRDYLMEHNIEGIVFWKDGAPRCKIKRSDFGIPWPRKK